MTYLHVLEIAGHWAAIGTAVVAIIAYAGYLFDRFRKMKKLEDYLRAETKSHSVTHLTAQLGMTEDEIFQASFRSKHITRLVHVNKDTRLADEILFRYSGSN